MGANTIDGDGADQLFGGEGELALAITGVQRVNGNGQGSSCALGDNFHLGSLALLVGKGVTVVEEVAGPGNALAGEIDVEIDVSTLENMIFFGQAGQGQDRAIANIERRFERLGRDSDGLIALDPAAFAYIVPGILAGEDNLAALLFGLDKGRLQDVRADEKLIVDAAERQFGTVGKIMEKGTQDGFAGLFVPGKELIKIGAQAIPQADVVAQHPQSLFVEGPRFLLAAVDDGVVAQDGKKKSGLEPIADKLRKRITAETAGIRPVEGNAGQGKVQGGGDGIFEMVIITVIIARPRAV